MCAKAKIDLIDRSFEATVLDENCIFRSAFFARSSHSSCSIGINQKDRVVTTTKAMRSEKLHREIVFFAFEGPAFFSVSMWGMKFCM